MLVLLNCVPILVRLDCFSHSITMEVSTSVGAKQPKFTETSTAQGLIFYQMKEKKEPKKKEKYTRQVIVICCQFRCLHTEQSASALTPRMDIRDSQLYYSHKVKWVADPYLTVNADAESQYE